MPINTDKTKYMCVGSPSSTTELENEGKVLPYSQFNYLGVIIDEDGKATKDIKRRIQQGRIVVNRLNGI